MSDYLYRVVIVEYPKGALVPSYHYPDHLIENPDWAPEGWEPDELWIERFVTDHFFWPSTSKEYKSRSGAMARKKLIESYGAKCIVQRSSRIEWPDDGQERIPDLTLAGEVDRALKVLSKVGIRLTLNDGGVE